VAYLPTNHPRITIAAEAFYRRCATTQLRCAACAHECPVLYCWPVLCVQCYIVARAGGRSEPMWHATAPQKPAPRPVCFTSPPVRSGIDTR